MRLQPKKLKNCQKHKTLGERHGMDSPSVSPEGTNPANILILKSGLQSCETIKFCCFKPPLSVNFLWKP